VLRSLPVVRHSRKVAPHYVKSRAIAPIDGPGSLLQECVGMRRAGVWMPCAREGRLPVSNSK
jgi:hypothetical protein